MDVLVSRLLPVAPSVGEVARRLVRHGLADVLEWLGDPVGPKPDDQTHAVVGFDGSRSGGAVLMVSQELHDQLLPLPRGIEGLR